jgi:hypothetical protein
MDITAKTTTAITARRASGLAIRWERRDWVMR